MKFFLRPFEGATSPLARLAATLLITAGCTCAVFSPANAAAQSPNLGPNVLVFDPSMPTSQIQSAISAISTQQLTNQFGTQRYALLFKPGTYGTTDAPLQFQVGFYTDVAGLGASPDDVVINGSIDVYNQCSDGSCIALDNFWRSLSNLKINVDTPNAGCYTGEFWAVSQASPMRRVDINGYATLMDYCTGPSYASGGFIADSSFEGSNIVNGSQQQFYVRNTNIDSWSNGVWNQVFSGDIGAPAEGGFPAVPYTTLTSTPVSREKPYLYLDAKGSYNVFSPSVQRDSIGTTWASAPTPGRSIPISRFFIATPSTPVIEINLALALGKNLILTPGVYALDRSINVLYPDTVVLGMGLATLVPQRGSEAITVADVSGVQIAGLIIDAGPVNSPVLLKMGVGIFGLPLPRGGFFNHQSDPSSVNDVYFRVGGATAGKATTSLEINSADVIVDNVWAWRADHGNGVGWTLNTGDHGLVVNGDRVTALGLAVEHYQKEQVLWNGNNGETVFYQSELPYDPPSQAAWMDKSANGYPSYVVDNAVNTHQAYGLGIYSYFNQGINIIEDNAMTVPQHPSVTVNDIGTVWLNGSGQITHVIDGTGATVSATNPDVVSPVVTYP